MIFWAIGFIPLDVKGQFNTLGVRAPSRYETILPSSLGITFKAILPLDTLQKAEKENREIPRVHAPLESLRITSGAGWRKHPITGKLTLHQGIDLRADFEQVYAVLDGMVEKAGYDNRSGLSWGLGNQESKTCSNCGMEKSEQNDKGCCKDKDTFLKNSIDQKVTESFFQIKQLMTAGMPSSFAEIPSFIIPSVTEEDPISPAPPPNHGIPIYILNCFYRI